MPRLPRVVAGPTPRPLRHAQRRARRGPRDARWPLQVPSQQSISRVVPRAYAPHRLIAALGCGPCNQGQYYRMRGDEGTLASGGPLSVVAHEVTTRFTAMVEVTRD